MFTNLRATGHPEYSRQAPVAQTTQRGSSMHRSILIALAVLPALTGLYGRGDERGQPPSPRGKGFTDITKETGVADLVAQHYGKNPKWWLSGLHLVDLDGDGKLDLFLSAHGGGSALAALNDGAGRFSLAPGNYPSTEIHLAYDVDEDGRVDLTMTFQDGGGKWWLNRGKPAMLAVPGRKASMPGLPRLGYHSPPPSWHAMARSTRPSSSQS